MCVCLLKSLWTSSLLQNILIKWSQLFTKKLPDLTSQKKNTCVVLCVWWSKIVHTRIWANSNNMQSMPDENHLPPFYTTGRVEWCCVYVLERQQQANALVIWPSTNVNRLHIIYAFDIINVSTYVPEVRTGRTVILGGLKWETKGSRK